MKRDHFCGKLNIQLNLLIRHQGKLDIQLNLLIRDQGKSSAVNSILGKTNYSQKCKYLYCTRPTCTSNWAICVNFLVKFSEVFAGQRGLQTAGDLHIFHGSKIPRWPKKLDNGIWKPGPLVSLFYMTLFRIFRIDNSRNTGIKFCVYLVQENFNARSPICPYLKIQNIP